MHSNETQWERGSAELGLNKMTKKIATKTSMLFFD